MIDPLSPAALYDKLERERAENTELKALMRELVEACEFTIYAAEYLYRPDVNLNKGMTPSFYFTLTYEGDLELMEKTKRARSVLSKNKELIEKLKGE